jgi:5-methylcytosine-specific restriction endonuclease McrA
VTIRIGNIGIIRRTGKDLEALRTECFWRDDGFCVKCGKPVRDDVPDYAPNKYDMAHIKSRGAGGSDVLSNVEVLCHACHQKSHNCGGNPLPRK